MDETDAESHRGQTLDVTRQLARHAAGLRFEDIPSVVVHDALRTLIDFEGVARAGADEPVSVALRRTFGLSGAGGSDGAARVIGTSRRSDAINAALLNGATAHALDFDDTHADFFYHGTAPVAPAVWALGEMLGASGRDSIAAFIAGWDVGARIARAVNPALYRKGWQNTPTCGVFGAAAAAGRLLGLDDMQMRHALGLAAAQSAGSRQTHGSMGKPFQVGKAASNGVLAALAAREGVTASPVAIEAPLGFAALMAPAFDLSLAIADLGTRFELQRNMFKAYACCLPHHAVIDAMLALRRDRHVDAATLERVTVHVPPISLDSSNIAEPHTGLEGKFSIEHSAAVALVDDAAGIAQYTDARVNDAALAAVRRKIEPVADYTLARGQCAIEAQRIDGTIVALKIEQARGHLASPLDDAQLEQKFRANVAASCDRAWQDRALEMFWSLDRAENIASCAKVLSDAGS